MINHTLLRSFVVEPTLIIHRNPLFRGVPPEVRISTSESLGLLIEGNKNRLGGSKKGPGLVSASSEGPVHAASPLRRSAGKLCDALLDQSQALSSLKVMRCKVQRCHTSPPQRLCVFSRNWTTSTSSPNLRFVFLPHSETIGSEGNTSPKQYVFSRGNLGGWLAPPACCGTCPKKNFRNFCSLPDFTSNWN